MTLTPQMIPQTVMMGVVVIKDLILVKKYITMMNDNNLHEDFSIQNILSIVGFIKKAIVHNCSRHNSHVKHTTSVTKCLFWVPMFPGINFIVLINIWLDFQFHNSKA